MANPTQSDGIRDRTAIAGVGASEFGRSLNQSQLQLGARALKAALEDAGLKREDVDGIAINLGWPLGTDYDRVAETFGLNVRYVNQTWTHGRFVTLNLQHAAMAVYAGLADCVACITACSFSQNKDLLGGPHDIEGMREEGGTHGENPVYGQTSPSGGAAMAMQRYMALYGATSDQLAAVPIALRKHAMLNPAAIMQKPLTLDDYRAARWVIEPLRLFDYCQVSDGACCVLVTSAERARELSEPKHRPSVLISGMQGIRSGRGEFIFGPPGLGINQQPTEAVTPLDADMAVYDMAGVSRKDVDAFYCYDAFSPLVLFALERFGFCGAGEAAAWVQDGRIELGGELPVNTSGGLLSEAHVSGWNSIVEIARQLRGECGPRQVADAKVMQWGTPWGDSIVFHN